MRKKTFRWTIAVVLAMLALSTVMPSYSRVSIKSPDGDYEIESHGRGSQKVRIELRDGVYVESHAR